MKSTLSFFNRSTYLIRLDDACVGFDYPKWKYISKKINARNIKPLIAIVPKNSDPKLMCEGGVGVDQFWEYIVECSNLDWTLGLHGYNHQLHSISIFDQIVRVNTMSEFATLSFEKQCNKIDKGLKVFDKYGLSPSVFVAPAHSFDKVTLQALKKTSNIRHISDGHFLFRCIMGEFYFIPQHLWKLRWLPFGLYTVCLHPSEMSYSEIDNFFNLIDKKKFNIGNFEKEAFKSKRTTSCQANKIFQILFLIFLKLKRSFR